MGGGLSTVFPCFAPPHRTTEHANHLNQDLIFTASEPLDETLGHSFVYVRSSARFLSPTHSDRFVSPSQSLRFSPPHELSGGPSRSRAGAPETGFRTISGASVSANTSTPRTVLQLDNIYDDATDVVAGGVAGGGMRGSIVNGFESTASFSALPLQPVPRGCSVGGGGEPSGPLERSGFFLSGPIERGALSGPLDLSAAAVAGGHGGGGEGSGRVHFSAPLGGPYIKKRRRKGIPGNWKAFYRNFSEKKRPWVVPVRNFAARKEGSCLAEDPDAKHTTTTSTEGSDVQWALGKAGEDRVHVVVSEEQGWLFIGIYDGFNGPDAPEFLMGNLYRAVHNELHGLFWELDEAAVEVLNPENNAAEAEVIGDCSDREESKHPEEITTAPTEKRVTFQPQEGEAVAQPRRRRLRDFLMEEEANDGLDLSGSQRFSFSVVDETNAGSAASRRWLLLSKLKQVHGRKLFPWRRSTEKVEAEEAEAGNREEVEAEEEERANNPGGRRRKEGPVDHSLVLGALSRALETTELAFLDMTDKVLDTNPELALMGSCLLVVLMRDEDVYVMNVGDSRAIVAQRLPEGVGPSEGSSHEDIVEESLSVGGERAVAKVDKSETPVQAMRLTALQLSTDHGTNIEEEIVRIKNEHPDDKHCIVNDRVKGRLKVTRAFGAGFLKQPKWNDALLEMFRNEYIGTAPYISCLPSLRHHRLCTTDQFLVLSSDGLYQYLSNEEVVTHVENFMEKFPDGDPAQHLIEELLFRAAKKAGMDFHDLLDIPQGDRRKYHDDVTVMIISLEGRIWKSSGKYP